MQNLGESFIQNSLLAYKEEGCGLKEIDTEYFCRVIFLENVGVSVIQKDSLTYRRGWGSAKLFLGVSKNNLNLNMNLDLNQNLNLNLNLNLKHEH